MKTQDVITENNNVSAKEAVLTQQLNEAMRLIRQLQRNNAELISQNTNLMKTNSRLIGGKSKILLQNSNCIEDFDENFFINDILSLINDHSITKIDNKSSITDNSSFKTDNSFSVTDKSTEEKDNKHSKKENKQDENDNKQEQIEINGKLFDRKWVIEKLRFSYNVLRKQNLNDEELIAAYKNSSIEATKEREKNETEKMNKVPALFFIDHEPFQQIGYDQTFDKVLRSYRNLKKRNKKNTPSLARQVKMLLYLYKKESGSPQDIFAACNLKSVTGFRYAAKLRAHGLIDCHARGTACYYCITAAGKALLENASV